MLSFRPLSSVMRSPVVTIRPDQTASSALAVAAAEGIHHLPVTRDGELVGIVCTCDLHDAAPGDRVERLMIRKPLSLDGANPPHQAARLMRERKVGSCIVTFGGRPAGIVTRADLMEEIPELSEVADDWHCECCRSTRHLSTNPHGQTLCAACRERAEDDGGWFDLGDEG